MSERDEFLIDLDALAPAPRKRLKFRGTEYAVRDFGDIAADDALLLLRADEDMQGKGVPERLELMLRYMSILVPDMDRAVIGSVSANQVLRIIKEAMGTAEVPPEGGGGASESPTSSPSSPDSTAGPSPTSGG
jgi:hypothetical protein